MSIRHHRKAAIEPLEHRRVLAAPNITSLTIQPAVAVVGEQLLLEANITDIDNDVRDVSFYLDNGDGQFDVADSIVGVDRNGTDGWQFSFPTTSPYRIMALGDSITQPEATQLSYRYPLWQNLLDAGYEFDLVGTQDQNHAGTTTWPDYQGQAFDQDHEGHYGLRADQVLASLPSWLESSTPDIVLLHLGTNDLFQSQTVASTLSDLEQIIAGLRQDNPHVVVLTALLIPTDFPSNALIDGFNQQLPSSVAQWNTAESPVILVDQNSPIDAQLHLYDGVHPNATGEQIMAGVWQQAIEDVRPIKDPASEFSVGDHTFFAIATDETDEGSSAAQTSLTIQDPSQPPAVVFSESSFAEYGSVFGSHTLTHASDNQYQVLTEASSNGLRLVQNNWKFTVPNGVAATVQIEAFHDSPDEVFYVNYSTDGSSWTNVLAVSKSADDDQLQAAQLPLGISGDVWIRIKDSSLGDSVNNSLFVDFLALQLEGEPEPSLPVVSVSTGTQASETGPTNGQLVVSRTGNTNESLAVSYLVGGTATPGLDYSTLSGTITIPAESSQALINVTPIDDSEIEGPESVSVTISPQLAYEVGSESQAILTIADDEQPAGATRFFPISEATVLGSATGFGDTFASDNVYEELIESTSAMDALSHTWQFEIPTGSAASLVLEARTSSGAERFYVNYSADNSNFQNILTVSSTTDVLHTYDLPSGVSGPVFIKVRDADSQEGASDTLLVDQIYIEVDDVTTSNLPQVSVVAAVATVDEAGGSPCAFKVSRSGDLTASLIVPLSIMGDATPDTDYVGLPNQVEFGPGVAEISLDVVTIDDELVESNESVELQLLANGAFDIVPALGTAVVVILDDDGANTGYEYALSEVSTNGSQIGSFLATHSSDDTYEALTEDSNGYLQHEWRFEVGSATNVSLHMEGFTTSTTDVFWVNYSTDGSNYQNLLTIGSNSDPIQTQQISESVSGSVFIKIRDSNRNGDSFADTVFVDELKLVIDGVL